VSWPGPWFRQHWIPIATGIGGFGIGCLVGWAHIGDRSIVWGTAGEWIGGLAAAAALWWAVLAFLHEREANQRRYAEMVAVLPPSWRPSHDQERLLAHVSILNSGPAPIDQVVVSAEVNGAKRSVARLHHSHHRIGPGTQKGFDLGWDPPVLERQPLQPTVIFRDAALNWWSRALDEPPKRLPGPPSEAVNALAKENAQGEQGVL
jgi:hypothetical protein